MLMKVVALQDSGKLQLVRSNCSLVLHSHDEIYFQPSTTARKKDNVLRCRA